tara:strand:- start:9673 stop:10053 length:381 start_codon:yes stop_codon:yes gene_type:complete
MAQLFYKSAETWLVCGGRHFEDKTMFENAMVTLATARGLPKKIINGGSLGADSMAQDWAKQYGIMGHTVEAEWEKYGKSAGPIRNKAMLDKYHPHLVIVFPGGRGTESMLKLAHKDNVEVCEFTIK